MCSLLPQPEGTLTPYPTVSHCPDPGERPQCQCPPVGTAVPTLDGWGCQTELETVRGTSPHTWLTSG